MLFDQEANKLQDGFTRLNWLEFSDLSEGIASFKTSAGTLEVSAPGKDMLRLRFERAPAPDYGILMGLQTPDPSLSVQAGEEMRITIGKLELVFQQEPLRIIIYRNDKLLIEVLHATGRLAALCGCIHWRSHLSNGCSHWL